MKVNFKGWNCEVAFGQYFNGNTAVQLIGDEGTDYEGEPIAVASVNGEMKVSREIVGIKDWSENEGMADALIEANVIEPNLIDVEASGFVLIGYFKLTKSALEQLEKEVSNERTTSQDINV